MPAKITGISSMATREVLADLAPVFERRSGRAVAFESVSGVDAARRVASGEPFDVVVLASDAIDKLMGGGRIVAGKCSSDHNRLWWDVSFGPASGE